MVFYRLPSFKSFKPAIRVISIQPDTLIFTDPTLAEPILNIPTPSRKKKTHVDTIDRWLSAFAVFCTVLLTLFPHRAVEMFAYQEIIRSAHHKFGDFAWLSYDIDFCRKAACSPSIYWGERDIQLYLLKFTGQAKSCCTICGSGDQFSHGCSLQPSLQNLQRGTPSLQRQRVPCMISKL